jgi:shikimate kinase
MKKSKEPRSKLQGIFWVAVDLRATVRKDPRSEIAGYQQKPRQASGNSTQEIKYMKKTVSIHVLDQLPVFLSKIPQASPPLSKWREKRIFRAMAKHITLVGMMGSGKSSVAPLVAAPLKRPVVEVDELIEEHEGMPIGEIFIAKGEAHFRRVESRLIAHLLSQPPAVLSLGGGAFQWEATRELLLAHTVVFYLSATSEVLSSRLQSATAARPLLNSPAINWQETIRDLLARRGAYYGMAHYRVDTDHYAPEDVAKSILLMREAYE